MIKKNNNKLSPFADLTADCCDTCLPCCFQPNGTGSLSHGHFAGLYYWLIAFKLSPLRAPLPSGDCLVGRQGAPAAATTQLCCMPPLCHVACIALSSGSPAAADLHINHPGWRSKYLRGSVSRCLRVLTHNVTSFGPFFYLIFFNRASLGKGWGCISQLFGKRSYPSAKLWHCTIGLCAHLCCKCTELHREHNQNRKKIFKLNGIFIYDKTLCRWLNYQMIHSSHFSHQ